MLVYVIERQVIIMIGKKKIVTVFITMLFTFVSFASATQIISETATVGFSSAWERTIEIYDGDTSGPMIGTMIYGFDTDFIDEDYTWTQSLSHYARAIVGNVNGNYYGSYKKGSGSYSKVEKTHVGNALSLHTYKMEFNTNSFNASDCVIIGPYVSHVK